MQQQLWQILSSAWRVLLFFVLITGLLYPALITLLAQTIFPFKANGSLIKTENQTIGSQLIGQSFTKEGYFWSRPSATPSFPYNAAYSHGANSALSSPELPIKIKERITLLQKNNPNSLVPIDLVTSSGSGLDPDISPEGAYYQIPRVAKARHISTDVITKLVFNQIQERTISILGEPRVNVLALNIALDAMIASPQEKK